MRHFNTIDTEVRINNIDYYVLGKLEENTELMPTVLSIWKYTDHNDVIGTELALKNIEQYIPRFEQALLDEHMSKTKVKEEHKYS